MKNLMKTFKNYSLYFGISALALGFTGCSDDDDGTVVIPDDNNSIVANAQFISENTIEVTSVEVDEDSWIVVRKVNDDGSYSAPIADAEFIEAGSHSNIIIELNNPDDVDVDLADGDELVVQLHKDDGDGVFEFAGTTGADALITDANGSAIHSTFVISGPSFTISDQTVSENTITFDNVNTDEDAWIVVHNSDAEGAIIDSEIVGWAFIPAGDNSDIVLTFDESFTYTPGQTLWSRIHMDDPADEEFTYIDDPATDMPALFGFSEDGTITSSIVID